MIYLHFLFILCISPVTGAVIAFTIRAALDSNRDQIYDSCHSMIAETNKATATVIYTAPTEQAGKCRGK